jgi:hypothetical protein
MRIVLAGLLAAAALVVAAPAGAAACTTTSGVTVVVQFPDHTETGCAAGNPSSGFAALEAAGFELTYAQGNGAGALCRIDGVPASSACMSMPPANAYWAYFQGRPGGSWTYATQGAGSYDPAPGSVEGWRFGGGAAPDMRPPAVNTPTPKPTPKTTPKPTARPTAAAPDVSAASGASTPSAAASETATATASDVASPAAGSIATTGASASATGSADAMAEPSDDITPTSDSSSSGGLPWGWGVALLLAVGAAAGVTVLRRRQG